MRKLIALSFAVLAAASFATWAAGSNSRAGGAAVSREYGAGSSSQAASTFAAARLATAKYVTNLAKAKADGYQIITPMIPDMGIHYMNAKITAFNPTKPAILVYEKRGGTYQLGALEWVFPSKPAKPPLPGAKYGSFPAACHFVDGTFVPEASQDQCPKTNPQSGAAFSFWHPNLVTLHAWLWYPNPSGVYASTNPLVHPFNNG
ncbi:MAG TPA: hypothetical protein VGF23_04890 [Gaiellaceae bacterium]|jgi:hypothetical protein